MKLSVLDLSPLVSKAGGAAEAYRNTLELARRVDELGYTRYWLAEHHNMAGIGSVAPELLIGPVASATQHIRVGSGGIMLPNHAPLKVAETFKVLEALHPGRIDLGIGRAPGTDGRTAQALRRSPFGMSDDDLGQQLDELYAFANGAFPPDHPFRSVAAMPPDVPLPPVWLLGSSTFSAQEAAQRGLGFAYAHHIHPHAASQAMELYRTRFQPSASLATPYSILAVAVVCADTSEEATRLGQVVDLSWIRFLRHQSGPLATLAEASRHHFTDEETAALKDRRAALHIGTPAEVHTQLTRLAAETRADEFMITMLLPQGPRVRGYELLASAFHLVGGETPAGVTLSGV